MMARTAPRKFPASPSSDGHRSRDWRRYGHACGGLLRRPPSLSGWHELDASLELARQMPRQFAPIYINLTRRKNSASPTPRIALAVKQALLLLQHGSRRLFAECTLNPACTCCAVLEGFLQVLNVFRQALGRQ